MGFKKGHKPANPIKKGETRNPNGRPRKLITDIKGITGYKKDQIVMTLMIIGQMTQIELNDLVSDMEATALERTLAQAVLTGMFEGNISAISYLIERSYGKPSQEIQLETVSEKQKITLPDGTIIEL